ncbi:unnamed protein product [Notodromas monacha]|uniref:Cytosol aminopeptidase n=1 Tax=Notodromas monacha TaxID=399045 RepID=A0A7R9BMB9_9CRUS|nr:unnamed protein product [Notodromas monacha]CAG0916798.1 unnamed protein product [Notodromas monacha]
MTVVVLGFYQFTNNSRSDDARGQPAGEDLSPFLTDSLKTFDHAFGNQIVKHLSSWSGPQAIGDTRLLYGISQEYRTVALTCLGAKDLGFCEVEERHLGKEAVRHAVAAACTKLWDDYSSSAAAADDDESVMDTILVDACSSAASAAEGATLALWTFDTFKSKKKRVPGVGLLHPCPEKLAEWKEAATICAAQNWTRWLMEMPANKLTPTATAEEAKKRLEPLGVRVIAHDKQWAEDQAMASFLSVSAGSDQPPVFLELRYEGPRQHDDQIAGRPIVLVGKGITFDSGGISLKVPSTMMQDMRCDMGGGAVVLGAIMAIASLNTPINVVGLIPLCENMPNGRANKVMDVVRAKNGKTIQIYNTDAEGRLILADALCYAGQQFQPRAIIDLATLTGAVRIALGCAATGCFTAHKSLFDDMKRAADETGDRVWRLPLWDLHTRAVTGARLADLCNIGKHERLGGSSIAAAFLKGFGPIKGVLFLGASIMMTDIPSMNSTRVSPIVVRRSRARLRDLSSTATGIRETTLIAGSIGMIGADITYEVEPCCTSTTAADRHDDGSLDLFFFLLLLYLSMSSSIALVNSVFVFDGGALMRTMVALSRTWAPLDKELKAGALGTGSSLVARLVAGGRS